MTPHETLGTSKRSLSWSTLHKSGSVSAGAGSQGRGLGGLAGSACKPIGWADSSGCKVTSASVTTLFLNKRSSSSSDEHLGLRSRKALGSGTHLAPHPMVSLILGWWWESMQGRWVPQAEEGVWDTDPEERN